MTTPVKARVLVADDHAVVRHGVRSILAAQPDFDVIAEAGDGAEAVERAVALRPHLVILDVSMPRLTGLQAAAELGRRAPEIRLLMLSMHDDEQYFFEALRAGASGYVLKSGVDRDLVEACRAAMRGESFLYPDAAAALIKDRLARAAAGEDVSIEPADSARGRGAQADRGGSHESADRRAAGRSARRRSRTTAPGSSRSSGCATASSSPATRSAAGWSSPDEDAKRGPDPRVHLRRDAPGRAGRGQRAGHAAAARRAHADGRQRPRPASAGSPRPGQDRRMIT